jgi:hypothetical protein
MPKILSTLAICLVFLLAACASATDRLEQGIEAESSGLYHRAAGRYIEALEKDAEMGEARDRLRAVGDSAVAGSLRTAEELVRAGDPVGAGEEYQRIDRLLAGARSVGVGLPTPEDYRGTRRGTFNAAIDALMHAGDEGRREERWEAGRQALSRARRDFEPDREQEKRAFESEARLLLDWALAEESAHRYRRAFDLAAEATAISEAPAEVAMAAASLRDRAIAAGSVDLVVFPITLASAVERQGDADPGQILSDLLELEYWSRPPSFIRVADPTLVRAISRRVTPVGSDLRPERVMDELNAEFGVLIEIIQLTVAEEDVRRRPGSARTRRGGTADYTVEEGRLRYGADVEILILARDGRQLGEFTTSYGETGPFERGLFSGDLGTLALSRGEARLFDPVVQAQQRAVVEDALLAHLAGEISSQVFRRVLGRIP